jgi:methyl-accepting chemotaxis protein
MFVKILRLFQKIGNLILLPLSKLKVLHQIAVIIVILIGFIFYEGSTGLRVIDSMQQVTNTVFNNNVQKFHDIYYLNNELQKLRMNYFKGLSPEEHGYFLIEFSESLKNQRVESLKSINPDLVQELDNELNKVLSILKKPITKENYLELDLCLNRILSTLQGLANQIILSASESVAFGKESAQEVRNNIAVVLVISLIISLVLGFAIAASVSRPLKMMVNSAKSLATGDLSHNVEAKGCYEATAVVRGLNHALTGLRDLIRGINQVAENIFTASKELRDASLESGRSATEVATAMEDLAKASSQQSNQINETAVTINELSGLVRTVSKDTANIAAVSEKMADSAVVGQKVTANVANEINELYITTKEVAAVIDDVNEASGEISEITAVISGIAEQTSLLALNASIEAARAGAHGKGFSIVAKETAKLAEQSKQSAQMIADLIIQMKLKTTRAVDTIQKGMTKVEAGKSLAGEAAVTFETIFKELRDVMAQINLVATSARYMAEKNESVINAIGNIATISEESMAATEEVSATTEEQSSAAQEVTSMAENLADIANKLKESISAFEIESKS